MYRTTMLRTILREYGVGWVTNRFLYSIKLRMMDIVPLTEKWYEKKTEYPIRLDLFQIDVDALYTFLMNELSGEDKKRLIELADKACNGIIIGFESIELNYGYPIDWQLNPMTGKRCSEKEKWYRISDFDSERGDIKIIWEASRFSHFIILARAGLLTGEEKYYKAFSDQLYDWLSKNPYSYGANFKCSQECSIRMVNAMLAYTIFRECGYTTDADASCMKDLIDRCYRKVLSNFFYAYKCIKNNHTISELMGMIVGAWCCQDKKQLDKAYELLDEVIDEQFTEDGGYRQFSFNYQRLALQVNEVVISISSKTGRKLNGNSLKKIRKSAALLYQCQDDSWDVPNYGNNDGALVFPVTSCGYRDFRPVINTIYALTTGKQVYSIGKHQEELIWFSVGKELKEYKIVQKEKLSSRFVDAGLYTIRNNNSWAMMVLNDFVSRPAHMDQLHFDLWVDGLNIFCDAGTYSYASEEGRKMVQNVCHNTVAVESMMQMNSKGTFLIYGWTKRKLVRCEENSFEGECISANGYSHIRSIKQIGASYEIIDKVNRDFEVLFHTPYDVRIINDRVIISQGEISLAELSCNRHVTLQKTLRSLYYQKKENTNCLSIQGCAGETIHTIITIYKGEKKND